MRKPVAQGASESLVCKRSARAKNSTGQMPSSIMAKALSRRKKLSSLSEVSL